MEDQVISHYGDAQAVADGVLVKVDGGCGSQGNRLNRVTRAVWSDYTEDMGGAGVMTNITHLVALIEKVLREGRIDDGWHILEGVDDRTFWAIPNEVDGLTLMYPEDY